MKMTFGGKDIEGVESVAINGRMEFGRRNYHLRWAVGLVLHPASTSCRPACGQVILAETEYADGARGPQISLGCRCQTSPSLLLEGMAEHNLRVPSQSFAPSSCSVSEDMEAGSAGS